MGALVGDPLMIHAFAAEHPPEWFRDQAALTYMRALYCIAWRGDKLRVQHLVEALEQHGELNVVGGREAVESLVAPRRELDRAHAEIREFRRRLPRIEDEPVVRETMRLLSGSSEEDE